MPYAMKGATTRMDSGAKARPVKVDDAPMNAQLCHKEQAMNMQQEQRS